jgi:phenylacetate-CoA ligase
MIILRGVNVFPTQIEEVLMQVRDLAPHFQIELHRKGRMDAMRVLCEACDGVSPAGREAAAKDMSHRIKQTVGISVEIHVLDPGRVARSEGKAQRIIDNRPKGD